MARIPEESVKKISEAFQKRISEIIKEEGCSKEDFAKFAGVNKEVISRASVYGIIPTVKSLVKIADYLDKSLVYVLGETDSEIFYKADEPKTFHQRVEELLKENNTKYSAVTKKLSCSRSSFHVWKSKNSLPSLEYLEEIAEYFKVSIDYLLGRTDERD